MFRPGRNIAMKLPERSYASTLAFYRDTLGLPVLNDSDAGTVIEYGAMRLHLDRVPHQSQPDIWLEIVADDLDAAKDQMVAAGATICNEVEPLDEGFDGFWIAAPAGTIHLVDTEGP